jgi:hypothetical protein
MILLQEALQVLPSEVDLAGSLRSFHNRRDNSAAAERDGVWTPRSGSVKLEAETVVRYEDRTMAAPGPFELLIIVFLLTVFVVPLVLIVAFTRLKGPTMVPCPQCRRAVIPGANFCHHCGKPLRDGG